MIDLNQHLLNPQAYIAIQNEKAFFSQIHTKKDTSIVSLKFCQELIQPYLDKYDINNYKGHIRFSQEGRIVYLLYKNRKLTQYTTVPLEEGVPVTIDNLSFTLLVAMISMVNRLLTTPALVSQLSFELKDKQILDHLYEFYRYKSIDHKKTRSWLYNNVYEKSTEGSV